MKTVRNATSDYSGVIEESKGFGLIDAAVVAIAVSISNGFDVSDTALLTNAACECILGAEATDSFSLSKEDLIHRVGEIAWNL